LIDMDAARREDRHRQDCLRQARAWLLHLTSGHATREDGEAFRQWCERSQDHADAFVSARRLWDDLGPAHAAFVLHHRLQAPPPPVPAGRAGMGRRAFMAAAITSAAAAMVVAGVRMGGLVQAGTEIRTATGEQRSVQPTAGVTVQMNTESAIRLPPANLSAGPVTLVRGEAIVTVDPRRASSLSIKLGKGLITVMAGSQLSVRCIDGDFRISCLQGKTELDVFGRHFDVKPFQQVAFTDAAVAAPVAVNPAIAFAWRDRVLIYEDQPLGDIVHDINRYRPGKIIITDAALAGRRVHARFTLDQMADVATLIHDAYGAHVTTLGGGWVLLS
jgi:ferric-dicitrate binding protein FerR (iron transport regulator)